MKLDTFIGLLLGLVTALVTISEWTGADLPRSVAGIIVALLIAVMVPGAAWSRRAFVVVGLALVVWDVAAREAWPQTVLAGLESSAFIAAFFTALATLRNVAATSPAIERCGSFLAAQPPGRRYAALTVGGHLFALILNYGSIILLGAMAEQEARQESNEEIRRHRMRRMLLAIQRGFVSTLPWSPLAFATAISISLIPGATWASVAPAAFVSGLILAVLGWAMDTIFKPKISGPRPTVTPPAGGWGQIWPLVLLLGILFVLVGGFHFATGIRAVGIVMLVVPLLSLAWAMFQGDGGTWRRVVRFDTEELPGYRAELMLLMMAGFIGTVGARLLEPWMEASGIDLATMPSWGVLVAMVWLIPIAGQLGMNPILSVSLVAPLLPAAEALGVAPSAMVVAITAGWALSGACSPFTATTLLVGALGGVSATHVGLRWNGYYSLAGATLLSFWVALYAMMG